MVKDTDSLDKVSSESIAALEELGRIELGDLSFLDDLEFEGNPYH